MRAEQLSLDMIPPALPRPAPPPPPAYTVKLRESDLDQRERIQAEVRFSRALEDKLGAPEEVRDLLRLLQEAEFEGRELSPDEQALARKWQRAHVAARLIGLQDLAGITGAWFEVQAS